MRYVSVGGVRWPLNGIPWEVDRRGETEFQSGGGMPGLDRLGGKKELTDFSKKWVPLF